MTFNHKPIISYCVLNELSNIGIFLEIVGFILLLREYLIRIVLFFVKWARGERKKKHAKPGDIGTDLGFLDFRTYQGTQIAYAWLRIVGIALIVIGLGLQFNFLNE